MPFQSNSQPVTRWLILILPISFWARSKTYVCNGGEERNEKGNEHIYASKKKGLTCNDSGGIISCKYHQFRDVISCCDLLRTKQEGRTTWCARPDAALCVDWWLYSWYRMRAWRAWNDPVELRQALSSELESSCLHQTRSTRKEMLSNSFKNSFSTCTGERTWRYSHWMDTYTLRYGHGSK